jgi:hypothetical protein
MKPENRFITAVNNRIPETVHREKMHNMYRGGTFDVWYSGSKADLWIEYKWITRIPRKGLVVPDLSALQLDWGAKRHAEGRTVYAVVGCPEGGVVLDPHQWKEGVSVEEFRKALLTKSALAGWIYKKAKGEELNVGNKTTIKSRAKRGIRVQDSNNRVSIIRSDQVPIHEEQTDSSKDA